MSRKNGEQASTSSAGYIRPAELNPTSFEPLQRILRMIPRLYMPKDLRALLPPNLQPEVPCDREPGRLSFCYLHLLTPRSSRSSVSTSNPASLCCSENKFVLWIPPDALSALSLGPNEILCRKPLPLLTKPQIGRASCRERV